MKNQSEHKFMVEAEFSKIKLTQAKILHALSKEAFDTRDVLCKTTDISIEEDAVRISKLGDFKILKPAFSQLLQKIKIPIRYALSLPFDHLKYDVETRSVQMEREIVIKVKDMDSEPNRIRAVVTSQYKTVNNTDIFIKFTEIMGWVDMRYEDAILSDKIFRVVSTGEESFMYGRALMGLELINSETGHSSLQLNTTIKLGGGLAIAKSDKSSSELSMKSTHKKKGAIGDFMIAGQKIIDNLPWVKSLIEESDSLFPPARDIMRAKDILDISVGRDETRVILEEIDGKSRWDAAGILANKAESVKDLDKKRAMQISAGNIITGKH